jgi:hypothetical protein
VYEEFLRTTEVLLVLWMLHVALDRNGDGVFHLGRDHGTAQDATV